MIRAIAALTLLTTLPLQAQHVTSRKASFLDVPARIAFLRNTKDPLLLSALAHTPSCLTLPTVAAPPTPMRIPHHYLSGSHGPTNPAEREATRVYGDFERRITAGMNQYLATGNHAEAQCSLDQLDLWAKANALTAYDPSDKDNTQSWFQSEWTLSSAGTTMSVLVNDPALNTPEGIAEQKRVATWLDSAARKLISFERPGRGNNNHHDWRGLAAISIGVLASDDKLFRFGVETFQEAIAQIDNNGAFPLEMQRHERAIHYQSFALQPLILIAEFATRQGTDLYAYTANGHTLRDAVLFLGRALDEPQTIRQYTPDTQLTDLGPSDWAPFVFYATRFGTTDLGKTISSGLTRPTSETRIGGSSTLLAAK